MNRRHTVVTLLGLAIILACDDPRPTGTHHDATVAKLVELRSREHREHTSGALQLPREARFVGDGEYVLVLDRRPPHLRLFLPDGRPAWQGSPPLRDGAESIPEAIGATGSEVLALEPGRATRWVVGQDSLALMDSTALPDGVLPLGGIPGCGGEWILYLRDPTLPFDVRVLTGEGVPADPQVRPLPDWPGGAAAWTFPLPDWSVGVRGHAGVRISRADDGIAILHRPSLRQGGYVLELDCEGAIRRTVSESDLATGAGYPVQVPRSRALEWAPGIVAVPDGFLIAFHRWFSPRFHDVDEGFYLTEIVRFGGGDYLGSVLLPGSWLLMDRHPRLGVLLTMSEPFANFIVLPDSIFAGQYLRQGVQ
jgi:hypothetical protein